jgi:predicted DNA-binding transcriptional regulator YafY
VKHEGKTAIVRRLAAVLLYTNTSRHMPNPKVMARGLGVHWRTVQRDLDAIEAAGWPMPPAQEQEHG